MLVLLWLAAKQKPENLRKLFESARELGKASEKAQKAVESMRALHSNAGLARPQHVEVVVVMPAVEDFGHDQPLLRPRSSLDRLVGAGEQS